MIKIKKIEVENFRAYKEKVSLTLDNQFVLLSGENGFGKTSLIDAIEWCLTGNIRRLYASFNDRADDKQIERNKEINKRGILKNKKCKKDDVVKVSLVLDCDGEEIEICRRRRDDSLDVHDNFEIISDNVSSYARGRIEQLKTSAEGIYDSNFLDMNKSYRFMNMSRVELKEQISDFIDNYEADLNISEEIKGIANKIDETRKTKEEKLKELVTDVNHKKEISNTIEVSKIIENYPIEKAYEGENVIVDSMELAEINRKDIIGWGIDYIIKLCEEIEDDKKSTDNYAKANQLLQLYIEQKDEINKCVENKWYLNKERGEISESINRIDSLIQELGKEFALNLEEIDLPSVKERYINDKKKYEDLKKEIYTLNNTINTFGNGANLINLFQHIVDNRTVLKEEYIAKGHKKCPLCGSIGWIDQLKVEEIGIEAQKYLKEQEDTKNAIIEQRNHKQQMLKNLWDEFRTFALKEFGNQREIKQKIKVEMERNWMVVHNFFMQAQSLEIEYTGNIDEQISTRRVEAETKILSAQVRENKRAAIHKLITILVPDFLGNLSNNEYQIIRIKLQELYDRRDDYTVFNQNLMTQKLAYLDGYLNSGKKRKMTEEIDALQKSITEMNQAIESDKRKVKGLRELAQNIEKKVVELQKSQIQEIGPYIQSVFCKIIKHSDIQEFNFATDRSKNVKVTGAILQDENNNSIMNMFSDGQMSVFMVAFFLGNVIAKHGTNALSTYFIDDVTSFLDDINMLSFLDMLKYFLTSEEKIIEQLFFCTCNKNVEQLMVNRGVAKAFQNNLNTTK